MTLAYIAFAALIGGANGYVAWVSRFEHRADFRVLAFVLAFAAAIPIWYVEQLLIALMYLIAAMAVFTFLRRRYGLHALKTPRTVAQD